MTIYELKDSEQNMLSFDVLVKTGLDEYFKKINTQSYLKRGMEWTVELAQYYLELRLFEVDKVSIED